MNDVVKFGGSNLPSVKSLSSALRSVAADVGVGAGGMVILKMDKTGHWVFGADQTEVEDDSIWAVNPFSFVHGYICWGEGEVLGEKMVGVAEPLPELEPAPAASKRGWEMQVGMTLACTNGEDEGMQARYSATSVGGKKAVQALAVAIAEQVDKDQDHPVPLVRLKKEHYQHKSYGRIFTPVFEVVKWVGLDAEAVADEADPAVEDEVAADEAPRRRRRATA
ncbi:hypothetical protein UFOVP406_19 [uncultured Caudovirales phage]|jgi:hypothetical protein|uniref:Uncharacterized protein n=1 Tax=uncultured Caudovirales phage TaxID=2100421 RepID=A0A6J5M4F2_9CAUD|nr:hypothetical protein UFOVP406_19 [uncultured Caudovirales phage]